MNPIRAAVLGFAVLLLAGCSTVKSMMSSLTQREASPAQSQDQPQAPMAAAKGGGRTGEPAHKIMDTPAGRVLATNRGMTLYTFASDTMPGTSMCNDICAANWPPLIALDDAIPVGRWSVVQRAGGLKQWAYDGKPLYGWREDRKPGDATGDGRLNGAWKAARP